MGRLPEKKIGSFVANDPRLGIICTDQRLADGPSGFGCISGCPANRAADFVRFLAILNLQEPRIKARLETGEVKWIDSHSTPSLSTYRALQVFLNNKPVLVTTADHAFLIPQVVDYFYEEARRLPFDLAAGIMAYDVVMPPFMNPDARP